LCEKKALPKSDIPCVITRKSCEEVETSQTHSIKYENLVGQTLACYFKQPDHNKDIRGISKCMLSSLSELHTKIPSTMYCSINPDVVVVSDNRVEFLDFFWTRSKKVILSNFFEDVINQCYAPELIRLKTRYLSGEPTEKIDGRSCDIFSVGCCIHFLATGKNPLGTDDNTIALNLSNSNFKLNFGDIAAAEGLKNYQKFLLLDLVQRMLMPTPVDRISLADALAHPFFWEIDQISEYFRSNYAYLENLRHFANDEYKPFYETNLTKLVFDFKKSPEFTHKIIEKFPSALISLFHVTEAESRSIYFDRCFGSANEYTYERGGPNQSFLRGKLRTNKKNVLLTVIKDLSGTDCDYCGQVAIKRPYRQNGVTHERMYCEVDNVGSHLIAYKAFVCTLRNFIETGRDYLPTIFKDVLKCVLCLRKFKINNIDISLDTICIVKENGSYRGHLLDIAIKWNSKKMERAERKFANCMLYAHTKVECDLETVNFADVDVSLHFLSKVRDDNLNVDEMLREKYFWSKRDHEVCAKLEPMYSKTVGNFIAASDPGCGIILCEYVNSCSNDYLIRELKKSDVERTYNTTTDLVFLPKTRHICAVSVERIDDVTYKVPEDEWLRINRIHKETQLLNKRKHIDDVLKLNKKIKIYFNHLSIIFILGLFGWGGVRLKILFVITSYNFDCSASNAL
jgi:serine/threonine protein kinase